jgi:O-antigen/teichoic acid export membrane protein
MTGLVRAMFFRLRSLIRNNPDYFGAVITAYGVVGMQVLVQIALIPLYLSTLGKYQFGVLMLLMAGVNAAFLGISWTYGIVLRILGEAAANKDEKAFAEGYLAAKWVFSGYSFCLAALGLLMIWAGAEQIFDGGVGSAREDIMWGIIFAGLHFFVLSEFAVDQMALNARKRQVIANGLLIGGLGVFVALVIPWLNSGGGIAGVFVCLAIGNLVARTVVWTFWRRTGVKVGWGFPRAHLASTFRRFFSLMRQGYLAYGLIFMALQMDILLVGWLGGAEMAAEFVLVWKIAEVLIIAVWRLSESLQPDLVHADALGDQARLQRIYSRGVVIVRFVALGTGLIYGAFGPWLVRLWVGAEVAPDTAIGYALAGAAIFWLGSARFSAIFAYALTLLRPLILVAGAELIIKLVLFLVLFGQVGYLAPLIAISVVHMGGIAIAYAKLPRLGTHAST